MNVSGDRRTALITGAAGGLGAATARLLAPEHDLSLVDIRKEELARVASEAETFGARVQVLVADLEQVDECDRVVATTISAFGHLDILVNAAAILARRPLEDVTPEHFDRIFHINTRAPYFLTRAAIRDMEKRSWGRVVNVTSTGVYTGGMNMTSAPYEASKGAVAVLTKMYARHGASRGVLVNTVTPGGMETDMLLLGTAPELLDEIRTLIPLGRLADPIEVARIIKWLVSDDASYATGAEFDITGGISMH
jgi:NAD(P)-dependent dehydrogenase (short-subunit alcohol dehydrogenase family)